MNKAMSASAAQQLFESAKALHQQGRLGEAEPLYRQLLEAFPGHPGVLQRLSEIYFRSGRIEEAAEFTRKALDSTPNDAQMLSNLGFMLYKIGRSGEALVFLERSLQLDPRSPRTHTNLGNTLAALNRRQEALECFSRAVELDPNLAEPHNNIGNVLADLKRHEEAIVAFNKALALQPDFVPALTNLGNSLFHLRRYDEAAACFARALELKPDYAPAHYNWGTLLGETGLHEQAAEHYKKAREIDPGYAAACNNLGRSLNALGRPLEAMAAYKNALAIDPGSAIAHSGISSSFLYLGNFDEARAAGEKAIELDPDTPAIHRSLAEAKRFTKDDPQIAQLERLAAGKAPLDDEQAAELHLILAKAYGDCGEDERAFTHLLKGNAAKRRCVSYEEREHLEEMRMMAEVFTPELMRAKAGGGDPSERPVFIIGMPRSGTTLVEQILAGHPSVYAAGEQSEFGLNVLGTYAPGPLPFDIWKLTGDDLRQMGGRYLRRMAGKVREDAPRFTDKLPGNFRFAGLIHLTMPNARLIHVHRNPLDTCVSCFSKHFVGSLNYTYDLAELGRYYRAYEKLMTHWRAVLPQTVMLDVRYEDLVEDFEAGARRIVAHCGLEWDARCLEFYKVTRPVITASSTQVRQPLFKTAVGRHKKYEPWLGPLHEALGEDIT